QVVVNAVGRGWDVERAIEAPRIHWEDPVVHCEGGHDPADVDAPAAAGWGAISTAGAPRRSSSSPRASLGLRATRAEAAPEWSSVVEIRRAESADAEQLVEL